MIALGTTLVLFIACGGDRPSPGGDTTTPPPVGGPGPAGSGGFTASSSSSGGAGGETLVVDRDDNCSCLLHLILNKGGACNKCLNETIKAGQPCDNYEDFCVQTPGCLAVALCVGACDEAADPATCIGDCAYPVDKNGDVEFYHRRTACWCDECAQICNDGKKNTCYQNLSGGGADGAGGA